MVPFPITMKKKIHSYLSIEKEAEIEFTISKSRFIARSFMVTNTNQIREKIKDVQVLYPSATHWCYAWRLWSEPPLEFSTDAGEPRGTAGRPILGAIQHRNLFNLLVVVTRYFGGKKLGIRGLIDAYQQAAEMVLDNSGTVNQEIQAEFFLKLDPTHFQLMLNQIIHFCHGKRGIEMNPQKGEIRFRVSRYRLQDTFVYLERNQNEEDGYR